MAGILLARNGNVAALPPEGDRRSEKRKWVTSEGMMESLSLVVKGACVALEQQRLKDSPAGCAVLKPVQN
jgi:hypothetical protein